jgi:NHLM bacteriocin system ABC transporter ATP-binding protein
VIQEGRWISGNREIILSSQSAKPEVLDSGSLVVFGVDRQTGERLHLFPIERGEPLLPFSCPPGSMWDIIAVPLEPSRLEPALFAAIEKKAWLGKIGQALVRLQPESKSGDVDIAESGRTLLLRSGRRVSTEGEFVFIRLESGAGALAGIIVPEGQTIALASGISVKATADAEWRVLAEAPEDAVDVLTYTLSLAERILCQALDDVKRRRVAASQSRLANQRQMNARLASVGMKSLAAISGVETAESVEVTGDPLFDAVRAVAGRLGIRVRPGQNRGMGRDALREIAQASGFRTRTVLLSGEWWREENGPLVAFGTDGEPVALLPSELGLFGRAAYEIYRPESGQRLRVDSRCATELNPYAQMLYSPLPEDLSTGNLLRHALLVRKRDLRTIVAASLGAAVLGLAGPQGAAILIGRAIPDADSNMIWQVAAGMLAAAFGSALFLLAQAVATLRAQTAGFIMLQTGVWDHLLKLSPRFFRSMPAGQLRVQVDAIVRIHQLFHADALRTLFAAITSILYLAVMFWYSGVLAAIALVSGALVVAVGWLGMRALYRIQGEWQERDELLSGFVLQLLNAVSKLKVAGAADRAFAVWARAYSRKQSLSLKVRTVMDRIRLFNMVIPTLAAATGFLYLLDGSIPLGAFLASNAALTAFLTAVTAASDTGAELVLAGNLWQRVRAILDASPEVDTAKTHPGRLRGGVVVENLTFRYRDNGPLILDNVSIRADPGECIALAGPSGSGKSTLLSLLLRFETPHSGGIYLDGRDLSSLDIAAVRRQIGVVTQDARIMAGSLFENISTGGIHTMEEVWEAARAAGLAEDIEKMPMGLHTVVSEGGGNFSGGQRQRLLIARALILKPAVLLFDEATSALDNLTQSIVTESLKKMRATRILVAHRLSTIRSADRIYVIDRGRVAQQGTYHELVSQPGLFARLASRQLT